MPSCLFLYHFHSTCAGTKQSCVLFHHFTHVGFFSHNRQCSLTYCDLFYNISSVCRQIRHLINTQEFSKYQCNPGKTNPSDVRYTVTRILPMQCTTVTSRNRLSNTWTKPCGTNMNPETPQWEVSLFRGVGFPSLLFLSRRKLRFLWKKIHVIWISPAFIFSHSSDVFWARGATSVYDLVSAWNEEEWSHLHCMHEQSNKTEHLPGKANTYIHRQPISGKQAPGLHSIQS